MSDWTQQQAIALCGKIEAGCPAYGCHVALTGGLLYKEGPRKDCDLLFYRIRQMPQIDMTGLFAYLLSLDVTIKEGCSWCYQGTYQDKLEIDLFFPEEQKSGPSYGQAATRTRKY